MSNHSAAVPSGTLDTATLMSFFGVTGTPGKFEYNQYQERIPYNWCKRPAANLFTAVDTNADTIINNQIYPGFIQFGGNTGKTNSFADIDTGALTGGVYNSQNLLTENNLSCFFLQAPQRSILGFATPLLVPIAQINKLLNHYIGLQTAALSCPQLKRSQPSLFSKYPGGFKYKAQGE